MNSANGRTDLQGLHSIGALVARAYRNARVGIIEPSPTFETNATTPGIGPGTWNRNALAEAQERHAEAQRARTVVYRLYTEDVPNLGAVVGRHFDGFTVLPAVGVWRGTREAAAVVEILGRPSDADHVTAAARDIIRDCDQIAVLVFSQDDRGRIASHLEERS